jgi:hypothetical protein
MSGLNEWADTNNILVLYPQVFPSLVGPVNGQGCWDWWGYDDPNYAKKSGRQLLMTKRMVDRITSGYAPVTAPQNLTATNTSATSFKLAWSPVSGAIGYQIYRDGALIGSTRTSATSYGAAYQDGGLVQNTNYTYAVRAVAGNGNLGPASAELTVSTR